MVGDRGLLSGSTVRYKTILYVLAGVQQGVGLFDTAGPTQGCTPARAVHGVPWKQ
jgi:hypothetical protein